MVSCPDFGIVCEVAQLESFPCPATLCLLLFNNYTITMPKPSPAQITLFKNVCFIIHAKVPAMNMLFLGFSLSPTKSLFISPLKPEPIA